MNIQIKRNASENIKPITCFSKGEVVWANEYGLCLRLLNGIVNLCSGEITIGHDIKPNTMFHSVNAELTYHIL